MLHKEILASTAEHTAALHERFAKRVPCRDKTKLLLTLRQWLTDLMELQAAGSSPSKETVMPSLKTVTGGNRDLNNMHEITDLLTPCDPGKLYSAIERNAARSAVMDADTRLSDNTAGEVITKVRTARRSPVNITPRALALVETVADSHTKVGIRSPAARAAKGRKRTTRETGARNVERSRNPAHWAKSCPEASSSAQVVLTSPRFRYRLKWHHLVCLIL